MGSILVVVFLGLGAISLVAFWTQSNLVFWISYFKESAVDVPYFLAWLLTLVGNGVILFLNIISEIAKLFI